MELDDYLASFPDLRRERFESLRALVREPYPDAVESMRYKMPSTSRASRRATPASGPAPAARTLSGMRRQLIEDSRWRGDGQ